MSVGIRIGLFLALSMLTTCDSGPGRVSLTLDLTGLADPNLIERFLFVVSDGEIATSTSNLLIPAECVGCAVEQSPCAEENRCWVNTACGFERTEPVFRPQIPSEIFPEGENITVVVCALDTTQVIVGSDQATVLNSDGIAATLFLIPEGGAEGTPCQDSLPDRCP